AVRPTLEEQVTSFEGRDRGRGIAIYQFVPASLHREACLHQVMSHRDQLTHEDERDQAEDGHRHEEAQPNPATASSRTRTVPFGLGGRFGSSDLLALRPLSA